MANKVEMIIVHHTGGTDANPLADTSGQSFEIVDEWHRKQWNFKSSLGHYIGYHYFIDKTGKVTQGRADGDTGAHTIGKNNSSLGICLAGNFSATLPTEAQVEALTKLLREKTKQYHLLPEKIFPHRKFANKECYGAKLSDTWAAELVEDDEPAPSHVMLQDLKKAQVLIRSLEVIINKYA